MIPKSFIELIQDQNYFPKEAEGDVNQTREILFKHKLQTYLTLGLDQNEHKVLKEALIGEKGIFNSLADILILPKNNDSVVLNPSTIQPDMYQKIKKNSGTTVTIKPRFC